jgi:hypothetical protein
VLVPRRPQQQYEVSGQDARDEHPPLSAATRDAAAEGFAEVATEFRDILAGAPALAEFLEILGWAVPVNSEATDGTFTVPHVTRQLNELERRGPARRVVDPDDQRAALDDEPTAP